MNKKTFELLVGYWSKPYGGKEKEWKTKTFTVSSYTAEAAKDEVDQFLSGQGIDNSKVIKWEYVKEGVPPCQTLKTD